jgi:Leucine-rich repeat (LRR) protein
MKKVFSILIAVLCFTFLTAQGEHGKITNPFTAEDWNKLDQHTKDSITKGLFQKYKEDNANNQQTEEVEANKTIEDALKNVSGTTSLTFSNYPKAQFSDDITKFKNLEEFTCTRSKALDLYKLFDQLEKLPRLKKLNLSGGDYKVLPGLIQNLPGLEVLILKDNNFTTLPDSFVQLKNLKVLNLEHNAYLYDDDVYDRIKNLHVEELNFANSGLEELNDKIGLVRSLRNLDISGNNIKVLPPSFSKLNQLEKVNISRNPNLKTVEVFTTLSQIPTITELLAQECNLDNMPLEIGKLGNIRVLDLKANRITSLPLTFGNLTNLEYLDLGYFEMGTRMNKISDLGPGFGQLKKLKYLNLSGNALVTLPEGFAGLTDLTDLNLGLNKLPGLPLSVTQLSKLTKLDLSLNDVSSVPAHVANLKNLEELHLDGNFFNQPGKKLKVLPNEICQLKNLKVLTLKDNVIEQLPDAIGNLTQLEKLDLRDNLLSTLPASFTQLKNLKWLDLKANDLTQLPADFAGLDQMKELNLSMNLKLDFEVEKAKLMKMSHLEFLELSYNNITKEQITPLRDALPNCKVINWDYKKKGFGE